MRVSNAEEKIHCFSNTRKCLSRRIPDQASLKTEIEAWEKRRNDLSGSGEKAIYYRRCTNQYGLQTAVNIAFCWDTQVQTKPRQQLEQALIQKWKSPFNKECWQRWGQPFG